MTTELFITGLFLSNAHTRLRAWRKSNTLNVWESRELKGQGRIRLGRGSKKRGNTRTRVAKLHFPGSHGLSLQHPTCLCSCFRDRSVDPLFQGTQRKPPSLYWYSSDSSFFTHQNILSRRCFNFRFLRQEDTNRCLAGPVSRATSPNHVTPEPSG